MNDIVARLRAEADASEELSPSDSDIEVMRQAADVIEQLREKLDAARKAMRLENECS